MLLHQLYPKPPNATHAQVSKHVTSPGPPGWTTLGTKRYPQKGFSAGACCDKGVCSPNAAHAHVSQPTCRQAQHTQRFHNKLHSEAQVDGPARSPNAVHTRVWTPLGTQVHIVGHRTLCMQWFFRSTTVLLNGSTGGMGLRLILDCSRNILDICNGMKPRPATATAP